MSILRPMWLTSPRPWPRSLAPETRGGWQTNSLMETSHRGHCSLSGKRLLTWILKVNVVNAITNVGLLFIILARLQKLMASCSMMNSTSAMQKPGSNIRWDQVSTECYFAWADYCIIFKRQYSLLCMYSINFENVHLEHDRKTFGKFQPNLNWHHNLHLPFPSLKPHNVDNMKQIPWDKPCPDLLIL